jgi:phosphoribosylformylglycinamidine synthase II
MGARPIALLDGLRFGEPGWQFDRAVAGIGHYGNCVGVPTVGGEAVFDEAYVDNCLVNAMCVGLVDTDRLTRAHASGPGNVIVLYGATTGRDGIGGASVLASAELEEGDDKRPTVQIGDPFEEKKVMECCLELLESDLLVSLQDLGAAGLTSSASEMASAGGVGIDIDVATVPLRNPDLEPFEVMVSESQERMLAVVEPGRVDEVLAICRKWETGGTVIGSVAEGDRIRIFDGPELVGDMPVKLLVDDCPLYDLEPAEPETWAYGNAEPVDTGDATSTLATLLAAPTIASKRWAFEQYDSLVQSRTVRRPEQADAAVLQLAETGTAIAISIDGSGRRVACDPYAGTIEAVLECAQNLACVGAEPLGLTNCLNFGNPEKPTVAWQLDRSTQALADACTELGVPVVGGNVSLYNETDRGPIYPTPVVGMVGELPSPEGLPGTALRSGDAIAIAGPFAPDVTGSELAKIRGELGAGLGTFDLGEVRASIVEVREAVRAGRLHTTHDISDGGLACALAETAIAGDCGLLVDLEPLMNDGDDPEAWLFGEGPGGFVLAGEVTEIEKLVEAGTAVLIGVATGDSIRIAAGGASVDLSVADAAAAWRSLAERVEGA